MSSDRYRGESRDQNYRGERSRDGRGKRQSGGQPSYAGQARPHWETDQWERPQGGPYRSQSQPYAEPQGDGEPYEPSGGASRFSGEGERWQGYGGGRSMRGSRHFDGQDRGYQQEGGYQGRGQSGGYGEYNYREEDSPRGRSSAGGYGQTGQTGSRYGQMQGQQSFGSSDFGQFDTNSPRGRSGGMGEYGSEESTHGSSGMGGQRSGQMGGGQMGRGRFAGKGPKGYQRSDERIREDVSDALERHGEIDASEIEVQVSSGEVTLEGTVQDRSEKRLAEDLIEDLPGVKQVHNRVRVSPASDKDKDKASNEYGSKYNLGKSTSSGRSS